MGSSNFPTLRSLARCFLPGVSAAEPIDLPATEVDKIRKVLRLEQGAQIAILPDDGSIIRCEFRGRQAIPLEVVLCDNEPNQFITIAQALPKGERLETVLRMGTELGVCKFILFPAIRSVVKWDDKKRSDRLKRFQSILCEAAEQSYRTRLPKIEFVDSLKTLLKTYPDAVILSESERATKPLAATGETTTLVVGPEGGWAPEELALIEDRGVTLGPLVLRTDTAGIAAAAALLFGHIQV